MDTPPPLPDPGPMPDPGPLLDPAVLHETERTRTYPCRACGGLLVFDPDSAQMLCVSCGSTQPVVEVGGAVPRHDLRRTMGALEQARREADGQRMVSATSEKEIVCQSCGGHTSFTGTLTAIRCPYCNTPIQRDDLQDAPVRLPVDGVLPFVVGEKVAREAIEKWINSRWFAPNEFKKYRTLGSFTSIYLTYFAYDADTTSRYTGQRGDHYTVTVGHGDNRRTETRTRWRPAAGTIGSQFRDLPALANTGLDQDKVSALEPWPTRNTKPYTPEYVSGHLSRTYDADAGQVFSSVAKPRIDSTIESQVRRDIGGDVQRVSSVDTTFHLLNFAHVLMPVWLLTVTYQQKPYQVFINGTTAEVQGHRPFSAVKITLAVGSAILLLVVALVLFNYFGD